MSITQLYYSKFTAKVFNHEVSSNTYPDEDPSGPKHVVVKLLQWHCFSGLHLLIKENKTGNVRLTYSRDEMASEALSWKSNKYYIFCVRASSLSYPVRNAHKVYYIFICGLSRFTIFFPLFLINGTIFGRKFLDMKSVILNPLPFLS